jgi:hypothetical protein
MSPEGGGFDSCYFGEANTDHLDNRQKAIITTRWIDRFMLKYQKKGPQ